MNAKLTLSDPNRSNSSVAIHLTDETLAKLNAVLGETPVITSAWKDEQYVDTVTNKHVKIEPTFSLNFKVG